MEIAGDFSAWDWNTAGTSVSTEKSHHGVNSAKSVVTTGVAWFYKSAFNLNDLYIRAYIYISSAAAGAQFECARIADNAGGNYRAAGIYTADGTNFQYYVQGKDYYGSLSAGTWHELQIRRKVGAGNGVLQVWGDATLLYNSSAETITNNGDWCYFGIVGSNSQAGTIYIDCAVVADAYIVPEVSISKKSYGDGLTWMRR